MTRIVSFLSRQADLLFIGIFVVALALFVVPMPTEVIDVLIAFNLAFAFMIVVTTIYLHNVLELSAFPAIILISAVFRLSLTVSTARLVLSQGDAGTIIQAFGEFVIAGNIVVGLVVFAIIALVQFIVVTKGAERIAEVSARFTLDSIPGKQLAIDADLRSGALNAAQAQERRRALEQESQFFGAMDGAMRFVKGDAIASLVVVLVNLIGGLCIGVLQRGLSMGEAAHLYSLLSVGDGLTAQIPSMLTAVSAGIVVSRAASSGDTGLGTQMFGQIAAHPRGLLIAGILTAAAAALPGFPSFTLLGIAAFLSLLSWQATRAVDAPPAASRTGRTPAEQGAATAPPLDRTKYGDPFVATLDSALLERLERDGFGHHLEERIRLIARRVGVAVTVPTFQINDRMTPASIHLQVENVPVSLLACAENRTMEEVAADVGRVARRYVGLMFSLADASQWLTNLEGRVGTLASEVRTQVPLLTVVAATRVLLASGVTLSQPRAYLEALLQHAPQAKDPIELAERGREALSKQIAYGLMDDRGFIPAMTLDPFYEELFDDALADLSPVQVERHDRLASRLLEALEPAVDRANADGYEPVLLVASEYRKALQIILIDAGFYLPILSFDEVPRHIVIETICAVELLPVDAAA